MLMHSMLTHWPQLVMTALIALGVGYSIARFGEPKDDTYSLWDVLFVPAVTVFLLYMGGFWTP